MQDVECYKNKSKINVTENEVYIKQFLLENYCEQKGNVCGATSVVNCLNYLFQFEKQNEKRIKTKHAQEVYYNIFNNKIQKSIDLIQKINSNLSNELMNIIDQDLMDAANKNNKNSFNQLLIEKFKNNYILQELEKSSLQKNLIIENFRTLCSNQLCLSKIFNPQSQKCSTWPIGNDLLTICSKTLSELHNRTLKVVKFMGNENCIHNLGRQDTEEQITAQWESLKDQIRDQGKVLLYHLDAHYAVIFGYREIFYKGEKFRQILTARYGQRPKSWVDFEKSWQIFSQRKNKVVKKNSVRDCLINWHGYKILCFSLSDKNSRYVDKDQDLVQKLTKQLKKDSNLIDNQLVERAISDGEKDDNDIEA